MQLGFVAFKLVTKATGPAVPGVSGLQFYIVGGLNVVGRVRWTSCCFRVCIPSIHSPARPAKVVVLWSRKRAHAHGMFHLS